MANKNRGRIYLVPTPLVEGQIASIPEINREIVSNCQYFLVESFKVGRRHIRAFAPKFDFDAATIDQLNKHTSLREIEKLLEPALQGHIMCILSDAGCPGIADPGSDLVRLAHRRDLEIIPLSGPNSITLALMASGMNGQQFTFHGYLSRDKRTLKSKLKKLETIAGRGITQIFMETPYRNLALFEQLITTLSSDIQLCIACDLTNKDALLKSQRISVWKKQPTPDIHKRPCIFLIGQ